MCSVDQSCLALCDSMDSTDRFLCPWTLPSKNIGVGCHFLLQGIFLTQGSNPHPLCLLHWQADSLLLHHLGSPIRPHYLRGFSDTLNEQFTSPGRGLGNIFCMDGQAHQRGTASCWLDQRTLGLVKHRSLYGRHLDRGLLWLQPGSTHAVVLVR